MPESPLLRPLMARDPTQGSRAATPLELLYDLCFVVAIARAAECLHHAVAHGHAVEGLAGFSLIFFTIWWAWMGFAWFASAFDNDDPLYRVKVFIQMVGVLVLAAGVKSAFEEGDYRLITWGYSIMRVGLVAQWLRAAASNPALRTTALRYAFGILCLQIGWLSLLWLPEQYGTLGFSVLIPLELLVPWWAEIAAKTSFHPHHIAERYGLLTIIVIGESVLAATTAIQLTLDLEIIPLDLVSTIIGAPIILFTLWWLYFSRSGSEMVTTMKGAFLWGYGHYFIFASAAAVGAGIAVIVDQRVGVAHVSTAAAGLALAIPVAVYLLSLWTIHIRRCGAGWLELGPIW